TVGRLHGRAGVAISIKGPGLANLAGGMVACALEGLPLLAVSEAYPPDAPAAKAHKRLDQGALTAAAAKGRRRLATDGPGYAALAGWSEAEVPAPVLLELAGVADHAEPVPAADDLSEVGEARKLVAAAERPLVIAGTLAIRQGLSPLLNRLQIPVFTSAAAKGVVHEGLPHAAGVYTGVGLELTPEADLPDRADLIVGIGLRAGEVLSAASFGAPSINIDPVDAPGHEGFGFQAVARSGEAILELLTQKAWGVEETARVTGDIRRHLLRSGSFLPAHAFDAVARAFPDGVRMVIDTGYFCTIGEHAWRAPKAAWCLSSGSGRYMGIGLPQAVAAALYDGGVPTVLVVGDGGIAPFFAEARLAVRQTAPLVVLQMSDGGYGSVRTRAIQDGLSQAPMLEPAADWRGAFEGIGYRAEEAFDADGLSAVLQGWRASAGPLFVAARHDADAYQEMVKGIR
ncbi:MAG: thiamine pyrophosphate-dependent enzyme, partial [Alphaproteobacteria bacterium]|nr:thiamine pyrophosphate-dependent enzyme [Alphaproteobacteria bacterium]